MCVCLDGKLCAHMYILCMWMCMCIYRSMYVYIHIYNNNNNDDVVSSKLVRIIYMFMLCICWVMCVILWICC